MIYFTADTHFRHKNIIKYCSRPFNTVQEMDRDLIANWNATVNGDDTVYHLGDFTFWDLSVFQHYTHQLNGCLHIIPGSHDWNWMREWRLSHVVVSKSGYDVTLEKPICELMNLDCGFVLCHYAMRTWNKSHYGSIHLYGHSHGTLPPLGRSMDVGVDANRFMPISIEEILERTEGVEAHNKVK